MHSSLQTWGMAQMDWQVQNRNPREVNNNMIIMIANNPQHQLLSQPCKLWTSWANLWAYRLLLVDPWCFPWARTGSRGLHNVFWPIMVQEVHHLALRKNFQSFWLLLEGCISLVWPSMWLRQRQRHWTLAVPWSLAKEDRCSVTSPTAIEAWPRLLTALQAFLLHSFASIINCSKHCWKAIAFLKRKLCAGSFE